MKIPKLKDLTDLNKLKEMGSSIAESANVGGMMNKVKQAVGESGKLIDKAKSTVGLGGSQKESAEGDEASTPVAQIQQSLASIFAAQKAQLAAMNELKHAVAALLKQQSSEATTEEEVATSSERHEEEAEHSDSDDDSEPRG